MEIEGSIFLSEFPARHIGESNLGFLCTDYFFLSFDFQRGRHWGMEKQSRLFLFIPETQHNKVFLTEKLQ